MLDEEINKAIHDYRGLSPELVEWWAYKDDDTGGSICFQAETKEQIERWLAELPETSWAKSYIPKAYYRYPKYCSDLNLMHFAEELIANEGKQNDYWFFLRQIHEFPDAESDWDEVLHFAAINATARQRAEAFLRTVGKYIDEPER